MISNHYKKQRYKREKFINKCCNGDGKIIDEFIVDKGHKDGLERHCVTDTGIIIIYVIILLYKVGRRMKEDVKECHYCKKIISNKAIATILSTTGIPLTAMHESCLPFIFITVFSPFSRSTA